MIVKHGVTRTVLLIGNFVFKFPRANYCHLHFLQGCYGNWSERDYTKKFKNLPIFYNKISPTIFCTWFGLMSIQRRVIELDRDLTNKERKYFKNLTSEQKSQNFGYLNKVLVCIDYSY